MMKFDNKSDLRSGKSVLCWSSPGPAPPGCVGPGLEDDLLGWRRHHSLTGLAGPGSLLASRGRGGRGGEAWRGDGQTQAGELGQVDGLGVLGQQTDKITVSHHLTSLSLTAYLLFLKVVGHWLHCTVWSTTEMEMLMF